MRFPGATYRVITCESAAEARAPRAVATRVLEQLGVRLNPQKTRIVHVQQGFDFLGYRIVRTKRKLQLPGSMIRSKLNPKGLIAYPTDKSIRRFRDRVRALTRRCAPLKTEQPIKELNPTLRGGEYYKRANIRTLFHKLDGWIVRRIWSHRFRRWRIAGWKQLPAAKLYREFGLVNLISLIPSLRYRPRPRASS